MRETDAQGPDRPDTDGPADPGGTGPTASRRRPARAGGKTPDTHVAAALRTAYQETVREEVPDEFMDLLGKLA